MGSLLARKFPAVGLTSDQGADPKASDAGIRNRNAPTAVIRQHRPLETWRLTEQQRLEIVLAYARGEKGSEIASRYDVDDSYPAKLAKSRGVPRRRPAAVCPHCGNTLSRTGEE